MREDFCLSMSEWAYGLLLVNLMFDVRCFLAVRIKVYKSINDIETR